MHKKSIFTVSHKVTDSTIWSDLLKVKDLYLQGRAALESIMAGKPDSSLAV